MKTSRSSGRGICSSLFFMTIQLLVLSQLPRTIDAFALSSNTKPLSMSVSSSSIINTLAMSAGGVAEEEDIEVAGVEDQSGKPFRVGSVVRVCVENRKAYQVQAKHYGSYNENKEFVPADADGGPGTKNLVLPVGMRGVVTKVYDNEKISANFPIQVKFIPGENTDEGIDPPQLFMMHFETYEVENV